MDLKSPFGRMVPIERPDGSIIEDFLSVPDWRDLKDNAKKRNASVHARLEAFLAEEHHRAYGRPWIMGRLYFDCLKTFGLRPADRVLDLGCGAGRVGIWLINFLKPRRYFGIDHHLGSLVAFAGYEAALHDLFDKQPRLLHAGDFAVEVFDTKFDVVIDFFMSAHLKRPARRAALRRIVNVCKPGTRFFTLTGEKITVAFMSKLGFLLTKRQEVIYPLLGDSFGSRAAQDTWHEFRFEGGPSRLLKATKSGTAP